MGSGLGFTIGKEKRNDQYQEADTLQKASTVGSLQGNVSISSHHGTHVIASDILAGKDISMTGENVTITSKDNVYHSDEKHEYKKSGLTVSANGGIADILADTIDYAKKASNARDKQLKALYGAEVYETIAKGKDSLNSILSGAASGATMEGLQPMLDTFLKDHPDMQEEVSSIFGYCAGKLFGGDGDVGAATAWNGTKFNWLTHDQMDEYAEEMKQAKTEKEQETVIEKWLHINALQEDDWLAVQGNGSFTDLSGKKGVLVRDSPVTALGSTFDWKGSVATTIIGEEAGLPWILNEKYGSQGFIRALGKYNVVGVGISGALDLVGDYNNYSNDDFLKAIFIDTGKIGVGIALGMLVPVPGVLYAPILDYGGYKFKTRYLKTNAQKFHESNMKSKKS